MANRIPLVRHSTNAAGHKAQTAETMAKAAARRAAAPTIPPSTAGPDDRGGHRIRRAAARDFAAWRRGDDAPTA